MPIITSSGATLRPGEEFSVSNTAVLLLPENLIRKKLIIQNTGVANVRVGDATVSPTNGTRLIPNGTMIIEMPDVPQNALYAIREGGVDSIVFAQEIT